jgi:hypothetical protein
MATVRISQRLREDIVDNAKSLFHGRYNQAQAEHNKDWGKMIRSNLYPSDVLAKIDSLGEEWFSIGQTITFDGFDNTPDEVITSIHHPISFEVESFALSAKQMSKYGWTSNGGYRGEVNIKLDATNPKWATILSEYKVYMKKMYDIKQERKSLVDTIERVLDTYTTLSPCIKAMPNLYDLLPRHTKARHTEILEKAEKIKPEELNIDSSILDVAMVKNNITKGGK